MVVRYYLSSLERRISPVFSSYFPSWLSREITNHCWAVFSPPTSPPTLCWPWGRLTSVISLIVNKVKIKQSRNRNEIISIIFSGEIFMKGFFSTFEEFVKSKNFEKIINLIPKINKAKNMEEVLVVLVSLLYDLSLKLYSQLMTKEAETNWDSFFSSITNEDYKIQTIDTFSSAIVQVRHQGYVNFSKF